MENTLIPSEQNKPSGFYPVLFVMLPLPYRNPKSDVFERQYGDYHLKFFSGKGVPSGKYPRSLMSLITTQYVLQHRSFKDYDVKRRTIRFDNLAQTMRKMGYLVEGATPRRKAIITSLKQLGVTTISTTSEVIIGNYSVFRGANVSLFDECQITWSRKDKEENQELFESFVTISPQFASIIEDHAVPIDLEVYNSLETARQQDLYAWLVRRLKTVKSDVNIPYKVILPQFFDNTSDRHTFPRLKNELRQGLLEIKKIYPEARIEADDEGLILRESRLHIDANNEGYV
jgi:hypothetical protein